ncbi:MAG TPA: CpsB/CapC family capsule biosynthesis tyrosine phosphatase [Solirubrobacteraceae bacterium]|nr:CpsB/CapC family capsule biosynthesis tyrosine phosphatase [Solirubrobacteraceae bacterium]
MIDLHCHVLPGIDDGPRTIEESLALARAAVAAGTKTIVATPHASARYPNRSDAIASVVEELADRLRAERISLDIKPGAEIAMTHVPEIDPIELTAMRLGGGPWLLFEPPFVPVVAGLGRTVAALQEQGHRIVLAHPERCPAFHRDFDLLQALVADGALTSITAGSLVGRFGKQVRQFATRLMAEGLVHNVASDAHDAYRRPPGIAAELKQAGLADLTRWLTDEVPAAILTGAEIPPRPRAAQIAQRGRRLPWRH